jgi:hypothetical protein
MNRRLLCATAVLVASIIPSAGRASASFVNVAMEVLGPAKSAGRAAAKHYNRSIYR